MGQTEEGSEDIGEFVKQQPSRSEGEALSHQSSDTTQSKSHFLPSIKGAKPKLGGDKDIVYIPK